MRGGGRGVESRILWREQVENILEISIPHPRAGSTRPKEDSLARSPSLSAQHVGVAAGSPGAKTSYSLELTPNAHTPYPLSHIVHPKP